MRAIVRGVGVVFVGCVALRGAAASSFFRTVNVPGDFETIQAAVDAVGSFAEVDVGPGSYGPVVVPYGVSGLRLLGVRDAVVDGGDVPAIRVVDGEGVVVEGFTVVSQTDAVSIDHGTDSVVRDVVVRSAGGDGIRVDTATNVAVTGNRVESADGAGIRVVATTSELYGPLTVTSNTVVSAHGDGIVVHNLGDGADSVVSDNVVQHADGRGIRSECGMTVTMERNDVGVTGDIGLSVWFVADTATITDNDVADSGAGGIDVRSVEQIVVADNRVVRPHGDGVTAVGNEIHVLRNSVTDAGAAGVRVTWGLWRLYHRGGAVGANAIVRPAGAGVVLTNAVALDVVGNRISDPGLHGVELDGAVGVHVTRNVVTGAAACGFRLENASRHNVLAKNTAKDCDWGLWNGVPDGKNRIARSNRLGRRHVGM